ncbi:MAG: hypothetical protein LBD53_10390 [Tannerella sp.]|jgi:hypothetical protein|nr:hypothetical protein [Tannerella sp.]
MKRKFIKLRVAMSAVTLGIASLLTSQKAEAQLTIGDTTEPMPFSVLELINQQNEYKGLRLPHLNDYGIAQVKDVITNPLNPDYDIDYQDRAQGLMVFNTDINCVMVWENDDFWSVCGNPKPAKGTIVCDSLELHGVYIADMPVSVGNYITVPVKCTQPGTYDILCTTERGLMFQASGTLPTVGTYAINVPAAGTPDAQPTPPMPWRNDALTVKFNGIENCNGLIFVNVQPATPDYRIINVKPYPQPFPVQTNLATASGVLPYNYYVAVTLSVSRPGEWDMTSNYVNGYMFGGRGKIEDASGYNPSGSYPQTVEVIVPVVGEPSDIPPIQANNYTSGGYDNFVMTTNNSATPSNYPFSVKLASVGFTVGPCGSINFLNMGTLKQNDPLPTSPVPTIEVPITGSGSGKTTITATFAGVQFTSGEVNVTTGSTQVVDLHPTTSGQRPSRHGTVNVYFDSSEGGMSNLCNETVNIAASNARFSNLTLKGYTNNGVYMLDPARNTTTPCSINVEATVFEAGEYLLRSDTINNVYYEASGNLSAGKTTITLTPRQLTNNVKNDMTTGVKTYKLPYDRDGDGNNFGPGDGKLDFVIKFAYRPITILSVGSRTVSNYDRPATATNHVTASAILHNKTLFGPEGKVCVGEIKVIEMSRGTNPSARELRQYINQYNVDIVFVAGLRQCPNAEVAAVYKSFIDNRHGFLFYADQTSAHVERFIQSIYGVGSFNATLNIEHFHTIESSAYSLSVMQGAFKNFNTDPHNQHLGDDCGDGINIPTAVLSSPGIQIISKSQNGNAWMFIDEQKGVFYCGDYAWANGNSAHTNNGGAWPSEHLNGVPVRHGWSSATSGDGYVYNSFIYANAMEYAIRWAAKNVSNNTVAIP